MSNQEYDFHTNQHRFPKIFQKWNRTLKDSSNFDSMKVHLFVDESVTMVYIHV